MTTNHNPLIDNSDHAQTISHALGILALIQETISERSMVHSNSFQLSMKAADGLYTMLGCVIDALHAVDDWHEAAAHPSGLHEKSGCDDFTRVHYFIQDYLTQWNVMMEQASNIQRAMDEND